MFSMDQETITLARWNLAGTPDLVRNPGSAGWSTVSEGGDLFDAGGEALLEFRGFCRKDVDEGAGGLFAGEGGGRLSRRGTGVSDGGRWLVMRDKRESFVGLEN